METQKERLFSLDLLRGLDIFLMAVIGRLIWTAQKVWDIPVEKLNQFQHAYGGFTFWDIIMPLFLFMCGAAIPFALPKRLDAQGRPTAAFWKHVGWRFAMLWVFGMICGGHLLELDRTTVYPYSNTLQAIAAGYVIAALALFIRNAKIRFALPFVLAAVYGVILAAYGKYLPEDNAAMKVELWILHHVLPEGSKVYGWIGGYTWWLTTFMFGTMTLLGSQSTEILISSRTPWRKAGLLGGYGLGVLALGLVLEYVVGEPCIKHIFTPSFTFQAMGYSMLALSALYVWADIWKFRRGTWIFILYGQFALTAYMISGPFRPGLIGFAQVAFKGMPHLLGTARYQPMFEIVGMCILMTFALIIRRRLKARTIGVSKLVVSSFLACVFL